MLIKKLMQRHKLLNAAAEAGSDNGGTGTGEPGEGGNAGAAGTGAEGNAGAEGSEGNEGAGKTKPSDNEAALLKDVMKQKAKATKLAEDLAAAQAALAKFEGIDATAVRELLAAKETEEQTKLEKRGEYDRLVAQMGARHASEKTELQGKVDAAGQALLTLQQQIEAVTVGSAFTGSTFVKDDLTLTPAKARVIYGSHFEFKDGSIVGYDKPAGASERTVLVDSTGNPLNFDQALLKLVESDPDKEQLLKSKMRTGAGSGGNARREGAAKVPGEGSNLTSIEKIAAGLKAASGRK